MMNLNAIRHFLLLIILTALSLQVQASSSINNLRIWPAPDHTRLVFDLTGPVEHRVFSLENPKRLVIDISNVRLNTQIGRASCRERV